jgi:hypothetical protein
MLIVAGFVQCLFLQQAFGAKGEDIERRTERDDVETVILIRHGEKPATGLGQLNCQGLNRALALPRVLADKFGKPDVVIAPNPAQGKQDWGAKYDYVRPLATVEPTAIYYGLPVSSTLGYSDIDGLRAALMAPDYRHKVILVAWEHRVIEVLARKIVGDYGGDPATVPRWASSDYDSIYVLRITRNRERANEKMSDKTEVAFTIDHQGLNDQPQACPGMPLDKSGSTAPRGKE